MARYQILYWGNIPLGVKATDFNGMVRENLPARFREVFENTTAVGGQIHTVAYTTSSFRWGKECVREGTAAEVAATVAKELDASWNKEEVLALF